MLQRAQWIKVAGMTAVLLMFVATSLVVAQSTGAIAGKVIGEDGKPVKDAQMILERQDIKGTYKVKTKGKGDYFHAGLPLGFYDVILQIDGKTIDTMRKVRVSLGDPAEINFNLQELKARNASLQAAAASGTLTAEQARSMTTEQREAMEKKMKEQAEAMKKNKALNEAFNVGVTAYQAKDWPAAIDAFTKAGELDPTQHPVFSYLAESYSELAKTKTGAEQAAAYEKCFEAYKKTIELKPDESGYHNNFGLALARASKFDEAQAELEKAAQLEPTKAGMYFYNLGAVFVNTGQIEPAGIAFKKAIEADPKHAGAQYQYGIYLISKATTTADGKVVPPPGTREAFQAYIDLDPTGPFAESAKGMIATIEASITTEYQNPDAKKKGKKK